MTGKLIVFEGPEAAGKTSQIDLLEQRLKALEVRHIRVKCPGTTPEGEAIRALLLNRDHPMSHPTLPLLMIASIMHVITECILPALKDDKIVLCDRLFDSCRAYQGGEHLPSVNGMISAAMTGLDASDITLLAQNITTLYLMCTPPTIMQRLQKRAVRDYHDSQPLAFHTKIYNRYHRIVSEKTSASLGNYREYGYEPSPVLVMWTDSVRSDAVHQDFVWKHVSALLTLSHGDA